tara:strand:+ start:169 stop:1101 length:933 start_codon:yes stop_codon:yes gene_type:complete
MKNITSSLQNTKGQPCPVLAIGNFDGMHRGHSALFQKVIAMASEKKGTSMVLTFDPHPAQVLRPKKDFRLLTPMENRLQRIIDCGIDRAIREPFTPELAELSPEDFVRDILVERLEVKGVWVGSGFLFGKGRKGTTDLLSRLGSQNGFSVDIMEPVKEGKEKISSSRVRLTIESGDVEMAGKLLGRPYSIQGTVSKGRRVGSALGFPTANLDFVDYVVPAKGVYASRVRVLETEYNGVVNIGVNPTFDRGRLCVEVHLFEFNKNVYGESAEIFFIRRIRSEIAFSSANALVHQIRQDVQQAKTILSEPSI